MKSPRCPASAADLVNLFTRAPNGKRARAWRMPVGLDAADEPHGVRTITAPVMPAGRVIWQETRQEVPIVRVSDPVVVLSIFPPAGGVANGTLWGASAPAVNVQVTVPFTAIFTVSGLKLCPPPLTLTS